MPCPGYVRKNYCAWCRKWFDKSIVVCPVCERKLRLTPRIDRPDWSLRKVVHVEVVEDEYEL